MAVAVTVVPDVVPVTMTVSPTASFESELVDWISTVVDDEVVTVAFEPSDVVTTMVEPSIDETVPDAEPMVPDAFWPAPPPGPAPA
jgi:hypothetical protein